MKKFTCMLGSFFALQFANAQTNIFPATGNAGIGTITPSTKLTVQTASATRGVMHTDGTIQLGSYLNAGAAYWGTFSNHPLCFRTNNVSAQAILLTNGNFGIGTTVPAERLTVYSPSSVMGFAHTDGTVKIGSMLNSTGAYFGTSTNHPLFLRTNNSATPQLTILQSGNIGIGTTTPFGKLDVAGDAYIAGVRVGVGNEGVENTCVGTNSLLNNHFSSTAYSPANIVVRGADNSALGYESLRNNDTGSYNTAIGSKTLRENISGDNNTAVGYNALNGNTTGTDNTAIGQGAMYSNIDGRFNTVTGSGAMGYAYSGDYNAAFGMGAMSQSSGSRNTATGCYALRFTTGNNNVANGYNSLDSNTTGVSNTSIGYSAMFNSKTGNYNTAVGNNALFYNRTGVENTGVGDLAGYYNVTGAYNSALGFFASTNTGALSNTTAIGYNSRTTASNQVRVGNSTITSIGGYVNWTNISDGRVKQHVQSNVPGLSFIKLLEPVTYTLDLNAAEKITGGQYPATEKDRIAEPLEAKAKKQQITYTGFIAQDVEKAARSLDFDFSAVDAPKNELDLYGLRYAEFVMPLVKAVQELSTQNEDLQRQVTELKMLVQKNGSGAVTLSSAALYQNLPNPGKGYTSIGYFLPEKTKQAALTVSDNSGKIIKQIPLKGTGMGSVQLSLEQLPAGTYVYSLQVENLTVQSRQMIVSK